MRDARFGGWDMSSYRDIEAYRLAHELGLVCHRLSMKLLQKQHNTFA